MAKRLNFIQKNLVLAYDRAVDQRDNVAVAGWKFAERERFLQLLLDEEKCSLVDIGSGPGIHAVFFQNAGLNVTCIDLSPRNVSRCREKGLEAFVCDVAKLNSLAKEFDAAYAMNSLLHVPRRDLSSALKAIRQVLTPGGLFYWGQYGGLESEGIYQVDRYTPKRFFSLLNDEQILLEASIVFQVEHFAPLELEEEDELHFQSLILRQLN